MTIIGRTVLSAAVVAALAGGGYGFATYHGELEAPLAVRDGPDWVTWWRHDGDATRWDGEAPLADRMSWRPGAAGLEWGELQLRGAAEAWRTRLVVVRLDPGKLDFSLVPAFTRHVNWTVADADSGALLALDAGQFRGRLPWGWVVTKGREILPAEYAPLAGAVVVDTSGTVRIVHPDSVVAERERGSAQEAFQSYPMLLMDGAVPLALRKAAAGVDLRHRDARLGLGTLEDGRIILALTRFDALGPTLGRVPFGLTTLEMAAVMGGLGARHALMLDGGISSQLMLRDADGARRSWPGSRAVPLGLEARSRN
jgi:uncharacterized protein YigE (DUF2233 family)